MANVSTATFSSQDDLVTFTPTPGAFRLSVGGTWTGTLTLTHYVTGAGGPTYTVQTFTSNPNPAPTYAVADGVGVYVLTATTLSGGSANVVMANT